VKRSFPLQALGICEEAGMVGGGAELEEGRAIMPRPLREEGLLASELSLNSV